MAREAVMIERGNQKNRIVANLIIANIVASFLLLIFYDYWGSYFMLLQICITAFIFLYSYGNNDVKYCIIPMTAIVIATIDIFVTRSGKGRLLLFAIVLGSIFIYNNIILSKKQILNIYRWATILLATFLLCYIPESHDVYYRFIIPQMGVRINPNMYAVFILLAVIFFMNYLTVRKPRYKILYITLALLGGMVSIYLAGARTTLIAIAMLAVLLLLCKAKFVQKWLDSHRAMGVIMIIGFMLVVIIAVAYTLLYFISPDFTILGKDFFSGREEIWLDIFRNFKRGGWIIGYKNDVPSAHNSILAIWMNMGLIPLILFVLTCVQKPATRGKYIKVSTATLGFWAILFVCAFETILVDRHCVVFIPLLFLNKIKMTVEEDANGDTQNYSLLLVRTRQKK